MSHSAWKGNTLHGGLPSHRVDQQFQEWRAQQEIGIGNRGEDIGNPAAEEEYVRFMIRQNLHAYVCYRELDKFTACLEEKKLVRSADGGGGGQVELNTANRDYERVCKATHKAYMGCMKSQRHQEAVLENACLEPHCSSQRYAHFQCLGVNHKSELKTNEAKCEDSYRRLLRCGLNHMWNEYWRAMTKFGDAEEFSLFELTRSDRRRQDFIQAITTSDDAQPS